uniref:Uncharacterized protein n=1 Tax=Panagrolaimus sp. PS1159 TaxID=55785 RepID=A0AC35FXR0_9BILA
MSIINRLLPFWKTTLKDNCQRTFPSIFRWFEQFFKPNQIEFSSSNQPATPSQVPIKPIQQNLTKSEGNMNLTQVARLVTQLSSKHRTPSIKFLGPRTPKPKYDANKYPMKVQSTSSSSSSSTNVSSAPAKISSIGKIGTTARGTGIDESQLPLRFRRRPIDEEEIAIINNGGRF